MWEVSHAGDSPSSPEQWNQAVENSADACLYHRAEIAPLFLEPTAHKLIFVECRLDGKLVGGAMLVVTRYRWHRFFERRNIRTVAGPAQRAAVRYRRVECQDGRGGPWIAWSTSASPWRRNCAATSSCSSIRRSRVA